MINIAYGSSTFIADSSSNWQILSSGSKTRLTKNDQTGTTYTLTAGDVNRIIRVNAGASDHTLTVPDNLIDEGESISVIRIGTGNVELSAASGVTINSVGSRKKLANQYSAATLVCITKSSGASVFDLIGDLKA